MPMWLAELTPTLFDGIASDRIYPIAQRYGELVGRWHALDETQWRAILNRFLIRCIDDAVEAARPIAEGKSYWPAVEAACNQSKDAIKSGDESAAAASAAAASAAAIYVARAVCTADAASDASAAAHLKLFTFVLDQIEAKVSKNMTTRRSRQMERIGP